jgi:DNA-binding MarR family transcriptional regulator
VHHLPFSIKRVHLRTIELLKPLAKVFDLTPARFDMLYALSRRGRDLPTTQADLRRILDVSRSTVSRMAKALEALRLITRERFWLDRRKVLVRFTAAGRELFERAYRDLVENAMVDYRVDDYVVRAPQRLHIGLLAALEGALHLARRGVEDWATLRYPWHPED